MNPTTTKTMILLSVIIMDLLTGMEFDLFVPSFPQLQAYFGLSPFWVEALLSINFIGYCLSLFFVGGLADRYGRKPIILLGLVIFIIGSLSCLCTVSYGFLILGRFLQGVGIAAPAILSFLIIADSYPLKEQQFLVSMLNGSMNLAVAIAPVLGSYLTLYLHWQSNFVALLLLGIFTLGMTVWFVPSSPLPQEKETLSWRGYIPVLQSRPLALLAVTLFITFVPYWIFVGMSPLLYMKDLNISLSHFGYYQGVLALVFALGSVIYGFIIKNQENYDQKNMLKIGWYILLVSFFMLLFVTFFNAKNPMLITTAMLIFVIAQIIPSSILYPICLNFMPHAKGKVSAIVQGGRLIFSALSLQITGYFYQHSFQSIGIIISSFVFLAIIMLLLTIKNDELMNFKLSHD